MLIKDGLVFCEDFDLREGNIYTELDRISEPHADAEVLDATGCIVAPGFIDIHIHGAYGTDFCDSTREAHENIARYLASVGITSYLGTTMAMKKPVLLNMICPQAFGYRHIHCINSTGKDRHPKTENNIDPVTGGKGQWVTAKRRVGALGK